MRRIALWLIGIGVALGLITAASLVFLVPWAEDFLTHALRRSGYPRGEIAVQRLGWDAADLRVVLDREAALQPATVALSWSLDSLLDGQLEAITLIRPEIGLIIDENGQFTVAGRAGPGTEAPADGVFPDAGQFPARRVAVQDGRIVLTTPTGKAVLALEMEVRRREGGIDGRVTIEGADARLAADLAVRDGLGALVLDGDFGDLGQVLPVLAPPMGRAEGQAALHARLSGPWPPQADRWTGSFAVSLRDMAWDGTVAEAAADVHGRIRLSADRLEIESDSAWTTSGVLLDPDLPHPLTEPLVLELAPRAGEPLRIWADWSAAPRGGWAGTAKAGTVDGEAIGSLAARRFVLELGERGPAPVEIEAHGSLGPVAWGGASWTLPRFELDMVETPKGTDGRLAVSVGVDGTLPGGMTVAGGKVVAEGRLRWDGEAILFFPQDCVLLEADRLSVGNTVSGQLPEICLTAPAERPMIAQTAAPELRLDLASGEVPLDLSVSGGAGDATRIEGKLKDVTALVEADADGIETVSVDFSDSSMALPDWRLAGRSMTGNIAYRAASDRPLAVSLRRARIEHGQQPAWFAPVSLKGVVEGSFRDALTFRFTSEQEPSFVIAGRHDAATGSGSARLEELEMRFAPEGLGVADVSPWIAEFLTDASGRVALTARVGWGDKGPADHAEMLLSEVSFTAGPVTVEGVNTVLKAVDLMPLVLPPGQAVAIGLTDIGLPLTQGLIRFGLAEDRLSVVQAEWDWAGGKLRAEPFSLRYPDLTGSVVLSARQLDLGRVLDLMAVEGLSGTGILVGELPVRLDPDAVRVENGRLVATGPGTLRYDPDDPPSFLLGEEGSGTDLLRQVLMNFHYESLALSVNGTAGGEMAVRLEIRGANPDLYDGYPVALNLNVTGALDTVLRRGLSAYRIPDAVREQMERFQQGIQ